MTFLNTTALSSTCGRSSAFLSPPSFNPQIPPKKAMWHLYQDNVISYLIFEWCFTVYNYFLCAISSDLHNSTGRNIRQYKVLENPNAGHHSLTDLSVQEGNLLRLEGMTVLY
jgi:hypothetical protein